MSRSLRQRSPRSSQDGARFASLCEHRTGRVRRRGRLCKDLGGVGRRFVRSLDGLGLAEFVGATLRQTASIVNHHLKPLIGEIAVTKLTTLDIDTMYLHLLRRGRPSGRALSAATVKQVHGVLHRSLAQAVRWGWVWFNPASTASKPSVPPPDLHPPTPATVRKAAAMRTCCSLRANRTDVGFLLDNVGRHRAPSTRRNHGPERRRSGADAPTSTPYLKPSMSDCSALLPDLAEGSIR